MYLHLWDFDHLRDDQTVRFREETVDGVDVVIISYMISNDDLWKKPLGTECRGITFLADTGDLISLPFEKFFNVNEKEWTQEAVIRDYTIQAVLDKRDGSMITGALINGKVHLKTKKSFTSDVAIRAQNDCPEHVLKWIGDMLIWGYSPIFEYTSPDSKIVINYGDQPQFVLLAVRDMTSGEYLDCGDIKMLLKDSGVEFVERMEHQSPVGYFLDLAQTATDIEGWVIYCREGRFKVKTKWYCDRHHLIDVRERDIAGFVLDETLDDLIPNLIAAEADMEIVRRIEREVTDGLTRIMIKVDRLSEAAGKIPLGKERADWVTEHAGELSKFVHRGARGLENSDDGFRDFYRQRYLSEFSLRSIGNPNFRGDDE